MINLLIVDDHPVVRAGMTAMFEAVKDMRVIGYATDGAEACRAARDLNPDVVLMDLRMPVMDGAQATAEIVALPQPPAVLVLTTYDTDSDIVRALQAGAKGYLLKDAPLSTITDGIRRASHGESVLAPTIASRVTEQLHHPVPTLSAREREVLTLVAQGYSNIEIGQRLYVAEATVKTHLARTFSKLGVNDRTAAVTTALNTGQLEITSRER